MSEGRPTTTTELSPLRREQLRRARRAEERRWRQRSGPVKRSYMNCPNCGQPHDRRKPCPDDAAVEAELGKISGGSTILTHAYSGLAFPAAPAEGGWPGYERSPEAEEITGAFRVIEDLGAHLVIGNGEEPEEFWVVPYDEWEERAEEHNPGRHRPSPDDRRGARTCCRCGEGKAPMREEENQ